MKAATIRQLVGLAGLVAVAALLSTLFSGEAVVAHLEELASRPLLFGLALVAIYLIRPFVLWPVSSIAVVLGFLYDPLIAIPVALLGAGLTAMPPYLFGAYFKTDAGLFGSVGDSGAQFVDTVGPTRGVIAARLSPIPGDPISYGCGLAGVPLRSFLGGTIVGEIPWALVAVMAGASMRTLSLSEFAVTPELILACAGLAALLLAGPIYNHLVGESSGIAP